MTAGSLSQVGASLSLCILLGIALTAAEQGWKARQDYVYEISGRTVAGIPSLRNKQHAGIHYKGTLLLQTHSSSLLFMKLQNMTYWQIHEELPGGWWTKSSSSAQEKFWELPLTNMSFAVKLGKGMVVSINLMVGLPDWEVNFIQGIVSQIQFKMKGAQKRQYNAIHGRQFSETNTIYTTMENTMFGRCETLYQVTFVPRLVEASHPEWFPNPELCSSKNYFEIFKTRNFSNCEFQTETHFGLPETLRCDPSGSYCGEFWNRVSGSRITGCADKSEFLLLQSEVNSRVMANLHLHNASMASVSSYLTMNLVSVKPLVQRLHVPSVTATLSPFTYQYTPHDFNSIFYPLEWDSKEDVSLIETPDAEEETVAANNITKCVDVSESNEGNLNITCEQPRKNFYNATKMPPDASNTFWHLPNFNSEHPPQQPLSPIFNYRKGCPELNSHIQKFKEMITDIASDLEDAQNIPKTLPLEKVSLAVQLCRTMSLTSLKKAIGKIMEAKIKTNKLLLTERKLYRDVVMMCGTSPALRIIAEWIEQYKISGESAASVIASLPAHLQVPDAEVVQRFYELSRSKAVRENRQLKITAALALSNFIRIACINTRARRTRFPKTVLSSPCTAEDAEEYLTWFSSQLSADAPLRRVYIIALGNTGTFSALEVLKATATDTSNSAYLRANAVLAMKYQAFRYPEETSMVLLSLYQDYAQPMAVRISAVSLLFYARPQPYVWQRLALSTWYEPRSSVAAFVRSSLVSLSQLNDPTYKSLSENARRVVLFSKPIRSGLHFSYNLVWARITEKLQEVLSHQFITTNELDASSIYYRFTQRKSQLSRIPFDGEIWVSNKDDLLSMLKEWFYSQRNVSEVRPPIPDLERATRNIRRKLEIKPRLMPDIEGEVHVNFDKLSERIFVFDEQHIKSLLKDLKKTTNQMRQKREFLYQKVDQNAFEISVVTEMGFAVNFQLLVPWAIRAAGYFKNSHNLSAVETELSFMYTSQLMSHLSFYTPWDTTIYTAGSQGTTVAQIPELNLNLHFNRTTKNLGLELQMKLPEKSHLLLHHSSQPFTSHKNVADSTPHTLTRSWRPVRTRPSSQIYKPISIGRNLKANLNYSTENPHSSLLAWFLDSGSLYGFWMMWPTLEYSSLEMELVNIPKIKFNIGVGTATSQNGKVVITSDPDSGNQKTNGMSPREEDLLGQIETPTNVYRQRRTIPTGPVRQVVTQKPTTRQTTLPPITSTTSAPERRNVSQIIGETLREAVEDLMYMGKKQDVESVPHQLEYGIFDAFTLDLSSQSGDHYTYLLRKVLDGISDGKSTVMYMNVIVSEDQESERNDTTYSLYAACAEDDTIRQRRLGIFVKEDSEPSDWEIGWTSTLLSPKTLYLSLKDILHSSFATEYYSSLKYRVREKVYNVFLKTSMYRDMEKTESLNKRLREQQCSDLVKPECRILAKEAMFLDTYNTTVMYSNENAIFEQWTEKAIDILRLYLLPYMSEDQWQTSASNMPSNMMKLRMNVADDMKSWHFWIDTKRSSMHFQNVPAWPELMEMLLYNPSLSFSDRFSSKSVCGISLNQISTFDEVQYNYSITSNWHILTKDASGKTRFMILARAVENRTMELEVNADNHIVATIRSENVVVNGNSVQLTENRVLEFQDKAETVLLRLQCSFVPEFTISITLPDHGMDVTFNSTTALITAHEATRGRLVGLCGNNDGIKIAEFRIPAGRLVKSPEEFAASYSVPDVEHVDSSKEPPSPAE